MDNEEYYTEDEQQWQADLSQNVEIHLDEEAYVKSFQILDSLDTIN